MDRAKYSLSPLFQDRLKERLLGEYSRCEEKSEQNCSYRLDINTAQGWARVKQFTNGTCYVEATDAQAFADITALIQSVTGAVAAPPKANGNNGSKAAANTTGTPRGKIELDGPYIGTDESGKGDYFGPLVIAGVYVTPQTANVLEALGVMDSKLLKDAQMAAMANEIKTVVGPQGFEVLEIGPRRYNELYDKFKSGGRNLNHMLAWGHAKVLENLLEKHPDCQQAIADQFGSEHYIQSQLQTRGKGITLHQTPKAEANIGVAAASILARVRFVQKMRSMETQWGMPFPFGANNQVLERAKILVRQHGKDALKETAKLHFKTTETVLLGR